MFCALCLSVQKILLRERSAACQPADYIKPPRKIGLLRNRKVVGSFYNGNVCLGILFGQGLDHLQRKGGIDNRVLAANHHTGRLRSLETFSALACTLPLSGAIAQKLSGYRSASCHTPVPPMLCPVRLTRSGSVWQLSCTALSSCIKASCTSSQPLQAAGSCGIRT